MSACYNGSITDQFTSWTLFIYLVFPEHLANDVSRNHLAIAFRDRYAVTLFRDEVKDSWNFDMKENLECEVLDVRASFNNLKCLKPKVSVKFAAVNKLWKYQRIFCFVWKVMKFPWVSYLRGVKAETIVQAHQEMRTLLLETLRHFVDLMDTLPGVVPAKLPVISFLLMIIQTKYMRRSSLHSI